LADPDFAISVVSLAPADYPAPAVPVVVADPVLAAVVLVGFAESVLAAVVGSAAVVVVHADDVVSRHSMI